MELFAEQIKKEHILASIDARVKIIVTLALLVMILSYKGFVFPLIVLFLTFILCLMIKTPLKLLFLRFSGPLFIASMVVILKFLFTGEEPMFSIKLLGVTITGYSDGLLDGLKIACRILGAVSIIAVLGFTTSFIEIIAGLSWCKIPRDFIEILMLAYRYIFVLLEDAFVIYNAQKNRLGYINVRCGLKSFGILAGTLVIKGFDQSQKTSEAMLQRGYTGNMPLSSGRDRMSLSEVAFAAIFLIFAGIIWRIW